MKNFISIIFSNKIIIFIIALFVTIIYLVVSNFQSNNINSSLTDNKSTIPYLLVTRWSALIKRDTVITLKQNEKSDLIANDKIRTFNESNATIFWPDWSITRLWSMTSIEINELEASENLSNVKIKFNIEQWKTWSNIIKFINTDSYFVETYDFGNYAATVRWTVFEMNLENNYLHAVSHDIDVIDTKTQESFNIPEWLARNLFDLNSLVPEIIFDKQWINENLEFDKQYIQELTNKWKEKISNAFKNQTLWTKIIAWFKKIFGMKSDYIVQNITLSILEWKEIAYKSISSELPTLSTKEKFILNQKLLGLYNNVSFQSNTSRFTLQKSEVRDMIIASTDPKSKDNLKEKFLKLNIYDYLELKQELTDLAVEKPTDILNKLEGNINYGIKNISDVDKLKSILSAFSSDMLKPFWIDFWEVKNDISIINSKIESWELKSKIKKDILNNAVNLNKKIDTIIWK